MSEPYVYKLPDGRQWIVHDRVVHGADAEVAVWVQDELGGGIIESMFVGLGIIRADMKPEDLTEANLPQALVGGALFFNHYSSGGRSDITCSVANKDLSAAHPDVIARILAYPFGQLGVRHISAEIDSDNERSIKNAEALGFRIIGMKEGAAGSGKLDIVLLGMKPEWCPVWQRKVAA